MINNDFVCGGCPTRKVRQPLSLLIYKVDSADLIS